MSLMNELIPLYPESALACVVQAVAVSGCEATNTTCICTNEALSAQATSCIMANSTVREGLTAQNLTATLCRVEIERADHPWEPLLIAFVALACFTVLLRLFARFQLGTKFWWDDACNVTALAFCSAYTGLTFKMKDLGMGYDLYAVPQENISRLLMLYHANFTLYAISRAFIRLSIILFLIRIFTLSSARPVMIFTLGLIVSLSLSVTITTIFACTPVNYFWNRWDGEHEGRCIDLDQFIRVTAIIGIVVDFWQLVVAVPFVIRLNLSIKKKVFVVIMFTMGIVVIILGCVRYPTIEEFTRSRNVSRGILDIGLYSGLELDLGIICACLPSIQVLFKICASRRGSQGSSGFAHLGNSGRNPEKDANKDVSNISEPPAAKTPASSGRGSLFGTDTTLAEPSPEPMPQYEMTPGPDPMHAAHLSGMPGFYGRDAKDTPVPAFYGGDSAGWLERNG